MTPAQPRLSGPAWCAAAVSPAGPAASTRPRRRTSAREPVPATAAPASNSAETATVEVNTPASTARNPAAAPAPRRRVLRGLPGAPAAGPAGITLACPVEAIATPDTVRQ